MFKDILKRQQLAILDSQYWRWYGSFDDESYSVGPFTTKQQTIRELKYRGFDHTGGWIIEAKCRSIKLADYFNCDREVANMYEDISDLYSDDEGNIYPDIFDRISDKSLDQLYDNIKKTVNKWQEDNNHVIVINQFSEYRNKQYISWTFYDLHSDK